MGRSKTKKARSKTGHKSRPNVLNGITIGGCRMSDTRKSFLLWVVLVFVVVFVVVGALSFFTACTHKPPKPPDPTGPTGPGPGTRIDKSVWDARQQFLLNNVHLHKAMKHQRASQALARGEWLDVSALPVDYWYWAPVFYAWTNGLCDKKAAERWFQTWVGNERGAWQLSSMWGSINHQLDRTLGYVAAAIVLGWPQGDLNTLESLAFCEDRAMAVLTGRGWVLRGINRALDGKPKASAGKSGELRGSRWYAVRNYDYLLAATMLTPKIRAQALTELDHAGLFLFKSGGILDNALWSECKLPFVRAKSDNCWFDVGTKRDICGTGPIDIGCLRSRQLKEQNLIDLCVSYDLTRHPKGTFTVSLMLFGFPWRPEFVTGGQIHNQHFNAMYFVDAWLPLLSQQESTVAQMGRAPAPYRSPEEEARLAAEWEFLRILDTYFQFY